MNVICLVLVVGLVNLVLGYALAVQMGYRPGGRVARRQRPIQPDALPVTPPPEQLQPAELPETLLDDLIQELISGGDEGERWDEGAPPDDRFDLVADANCKAEAPLRADDGSPAGRLLAIRTQVDEHLDWLVDFDTRIRQIEGRHELFTLLAWFEEFKEGCRLQRGDGPGGGESLASRREQVEGVTEGGEMPAALARHAAQLDTAIALADHVDLKGDPAVAAAALLETIDLVQSAAHQLRDALDEPLLAVMRSKGRALAVDESLITDPLTQLPNRLGLESTFSQWWERGGRATRPLWGVLFDFDRFAEVNETHGLKASDGILRATAEEIGSLLGDNDVVARYGGKRLLLLIFDASAAAAVERAETVRQTIGKARFVRGQAEIHVTLSAGVAAALPGETPDGLLGRLEDAVTAAKGSGHDCSFLHDGRQAELIDPAELVVEPREVYV